MSKLLIPLAYLNEATNQSQNIDEKLYKVSLKMAQFDLEAILGAEFYAEIETQYAASGDTLTTANSALYENYLKDYLAWATYGRSLGFSQSFSTPTGERTFKDDNSEPLTDLQLISKEKNILTTVSLYKNRIINYLNNEQSKDSTAFPLYEGCKTGDFGWGISGIERNSEEDKIISITKAVIGNE